MSASVGDIVRGAQGIVAVRSNLSSERRQFVKRALEMSSLVCPISNGSLMQIRLWQLPNGVERRRLGSANSSCYDGLRLILLQQPHPSPPLSSASVCPVSPHTAIQHPLLRVKQSKRSEG
ncbi:hypothetical protein RRG08_032071 [Elysia crispata]|uniref:Uncharacterized protein n=1 Tax=Elysia crispata TaxID=231223 RepID=A0AAE1DGN3_9GAST|nr:hypothetical protein RRG08_032071 [Elysia crispata]